MNEVSLRVRDIERKVGRIKAGKDKPMQFVGVVPRGDAVNTWSLIEKYLEWVGVNRSDATVRCIKSSMVQFAEWAGDRKFVYKCGLADGMVLLDWYSHCQRTMTKAVAHNTSAHIATFVKWLNSAGLITNCPSNNIKPPPLPPAKPMVPMTVEDYEKLKAASVGTFWHWAVVAAWHIGGSISDIAFLRHSDVDWDKLMIKFIRIKTKRAGAVQEVAIMPGSELHTMLLELKAQPPDNHYPNDPDRGIYYLCPPMAARAIDGVMAGRGQLSYLFRKLCHRAGIDKRKTFHSFRCRLCTDAIASGISQPIVMRMMGHIGPAMMARYLKPTEEAMRAEYGKLAQYRALRQ